MAKDKQMEKIKEVAKKGKANEVELDLSNSGTKKAKKHMKEMSDLISSVELEENDAYLQLLNTHKTANELVKACAEGKTAQVKKLLDEGAKIDMWDDNTGMFALGVAKNKAICELLIKAGADPEKRNDHGETPVHQQMRTFKKDVMEYFLKIGIPVNFVDGNKRTFLYYAAEYNNDAAVKWCLSKDMDIDHEDGLGNTPFLYAASISERSTKKALEALVKAGSTKYAVNRLGLTALEMAQSMKAGKIIRKAQIDKKDVKEKKGFDEDHFVEKKGKFANSEGLAYLTQLFSDVDLTHVANSEFEHEFGTETNIGEIIVEETVKKAPKKKAPKKEAKKENTEE